MTRLPQLLPLLCLALSLPASAQGDPPAGQGDPPAGQGQAVPPPQGQVVLTNQTLAIVNDQVVTSMQVQIETLGTAYRARLRGETVTEADLASFQESAFRDLLLNALFREGFRLTGQNEAILDRIVSAEIDAEVEQHGSLAAYTDFIEKTGRTVQQDTEAKRRLYTSIIFLQVEQGYQPSKGSAYKAEIYVKPNEVRKYYDEHPEEFTREFRVAPRILVVSDDPESGRAEDRIRDLERQIRAGLVGFADAAREHSELRASTGGYLGFRPLDDHRLKEELKDFLREAEEGQISEPLLLTDSAAGQRWALLFVDEIQQAGKIPFNEVELQIMGRMLENSRLAILRETVNRLRTRCYLWGPNVEKALDSAFQPIPITDSGAGNPANSGPNG